MTTASIHNRHLQTSSRRRGKESSSHLQDATEWKLISVWAANGKFKMQETSSGGPEIPRIQRLLQSSWHSKHQSFIRGIRDSIWWRIISFTVCRDTSTGPQRIPQVPRGSCSRSHFGLFSEVDPTTVWLLSTTVCLSLSMWNTLFVLLLINEFGWYLDRPLKNKLVGPTKLSLEMSSPQVHVGMWCSLQFECEAQWRWVPMFSGWLHAS